MDTELASQGREHEVVGLVVVVPAQNPPRKRREGLQGSTDSQRDLGLVVTAVEEEVLDDRTRSAASFAVVFDDLSFD